ncbi:MAG: CRISPR system precrRNA processing endoribonuclease RAMP protein Cas6 [Thermodesulfobacteriota bacterium]
MEKTMQYGKYRFVCRLESEAALPFFKGSTFRGVFGHALKRVVCALRLRECPDCLLRETCLYPQVFERSRDDSVHPFVIEPPVDGERRYQAGERFDCSLILFGESVQRLPYFVYAFEQMGEIGIGGRVNGSRGRFVLEEVQAGGNVIYSKETRSLLKSEGMEPLSLGDGDKAAGSVRVTLETPLRLKFENRLTAELPFHVLVRAMLRRVSSLFNTFGGGEPELDYRGLVREAQAVRTKASSLRWFDWERYSNRQQTRMLMGGLIGSVTYEGDLGQYLPLLDLASIVHIGKQTTFGMGKIAWELKAPVDLREER